MSAASPLLEVRELRRSFGAVAAVDGVSFTLAAGEIYGFVGPNGAGKTTTMRILATLDEPSGGEVLLDGVSLLDEPERARGLVGYMPDLEPQPRDLSVHEYLDFFARAFGLRLPQRRDVVAQVETFTNLGGLRGKPMQALSKGMAQRVSLARALLHDPRVLVLDEPAAGLDPRARIELRELLRALAEAGKAVLISSHILSELAEICHGAVILERGRIVRAGTMAELLAAPAAGSTVRLRALLPLDELRRALVASPGVEAVRMVAHEVEVDLAGGEAAAAALLAALVGAGLPVVEFRQQRNGLEEVFMAVTRGEVA
jgi:ABC-2 type transport system ATP-binding protein